MRRAWWSGAAFVVFTAVFSQAQASAPSASNQPTSNTKAGTATQAAGPAPSTQSKDDSGTSHPLHLRLGTVPWAYNYWPGYPYYYGFEPFYPYYGFASPWLWEPYWMGPPLTYPGNGKGEVRLSAEPKTAQVFLDGAYAGTADKLKSMWLDPGAYDLAVSTPNRESFYQRIYVLSGKSLKISAKLVASANNPEGKP